MSTTLTTTHIASEQDVVNVRQIVRQIADMLGFDIHDQTRIATAVSEVARDVVQHADHGTAVFELNGGSPNSLRVTIHDEGSGIGDMSGGVESQDEHAMLGTGLAAAKRLMDTFLIQSTPKQGVTVVLTKTLRKAVDFSPSRIDEIIQELAQRPVADADAYREISRQNQELAVAINELLRREVEMRRLNQELDDTNRGVVALYAELEERAGYLQQVSDLKTNFLANMSHEFRTPLSAIVSLCDILLQGYDGDLTPDQNQQVELIRTSANSLTETVNDLLDIAKIEAGKSIVRPARLELRDLFDALRSLFKPIIVGIATQLIFEQPADIPTLFTDEAKIAQILRNLVSNALKFTPTGEIRVSSRMIDDKTICIEVSDTGVGIEPENLDRIFEEFIQIEGTPNRSKGTGLGLPLSRKLARLLNGDLNATSTPGVGSTFYVTLPVVVQGCEGISDSSDPKYKPEASRIRFVK